MAIEFAIQASRPRSILVREPTDETLSDAIQTVFPLLTEWAILVWNGIFVPLGYKYDVSLLVPDLLVLLDDMCEHFSGSQVIEWPTNTFASRWSIHWDAGHVKVDADWRSVIGCTEPLLTSRNTIELPKDAFVAEWKELLMVVHTALVQAGYDAATIQGLESLIATIERIGGTGMLYKEST